VSFVLDSSALLAVLLEELGADKVIAAMRGSQISAVNLCEVYTRLIDANISLPKAQLQIARFELDVLPFDDLNALHAAALRPLTKHLGLSFGDRACLAQAQLSGLPVLTADKDWSKLDIGIDIRQIR
jgi:ribonuclease VapC